MPQHRGIACRVPKEHILDHITSHYGFEDPPHSLGIDLWIEDAAWFDQQRGFQLAESMTPRDPQAHFPRHLSA